MSLKFRLSITIALIAISVIVFVVSNMGNSRSVLRDFLIASHGGSGFEEIFSGQVWRLITPIFVHFGILHIVFNMLWLWDLGNLIETRKGEGFFAGFVLIVGIVSNLVQYIVTGSPYFGGMSGVVYGLLGYVWMQGRYNARFGYELHQQTVVMMLIWYVLGWTGLLGPIANWAHTGGLALGVAWGYFARK